MSRSIEREIRIAAAPEVVYEVVSSPEHLREWWPDEADYKPVPGGTGTVGFRQDDGTLTVGLTVLEAEPPRRFVFRWDYDGDTATPQNSVLVTFDLLAADGGTLLRFAETGFDEAAKSDELFADHTSGWDYFLPRIAPYVARLVARP
ncbi:SRPBCC domain-containing protein [Kribbella sp.]|uniref:SRPBCC domain-containing protein n=1 Tax=Kribbella sp. TaxID=1871183 RepID=UPI002D4F0029|nr:SRPBCC domain-containing protein [Kribbella sp.]HZX08023.1 SRPBCC domain-containing protein [Kribbella sp.]